MNESPNEHFAYKGRGSSAGDDLICSQTSCAVMYVLKPQGVLSHPQCPGWIKLQGSGVEGRSQCKKGGCSKILEYVTGGNSILQLLGDSEYYNESIFGNIGHHTVVFCFWGKKFKKIKTKIV